MVEKKWIDQKFMIQLQYRNNFQIKFSKKQNLKCKNANENLLFIVDNELHVKKSVGFIILWRQGFLLWQDPLKQFPVFKHM